MSAAVLQPMTLKSFLEWERKQERPYEFDGYRVVPMNAGTIEHGLIVSSVHFALYSKLLGTRGQVFTSSVKVVVAGRVRYPDVIVTFTRAGAGTDIVVDPVVVVEVLSSSTLRTDWIAKNEEYRQTPSIQHYLILEQTSPAATLFSRRGQEWLGRVITGEAPIELPAIGVTLALAEIYDRVVFVEE